MTDRLVAAYSALADLELDRIRDHAPDEEIIALAEMKYRLAHWDSHPQYRMGPLP